MSNAEFLNWIATKLKTVIVTELKTVIVAEFKDESIASREGWKRDNTTFESEYLSCNEDVTVADIYVIYDWLKGHKIDMSLPIVKNIFGNIRSKDQLKKIKDKRSEIDFIQDNAECLTDEIKETYNERIANLEEQIAELKDEMNNKCAEINHDAYLKVKAIREELKTLE